jgi:hypothetical protein
MVEMRSDAGYCSLYNKGKGCGFKKMPFPRKITRLQFSVYPQINTGKIVLTDFQSEVYYCNTAAPEKWRMNNILH